MPDEIILAYERAIGLVGVSVWEKLSDDIRSKMLDEELSLLATEQLEPARVILT
jgi:hypothetical protein